MDQALTISNESLPQPAMDFDLLRKEGIQYLEQLSGNTWTDFNSHDPGITILEQLCYAITDLGYRIDYDIKDLLAAEGQKPYEGLFSPREILTANPLTILDFRKLIVDVVGVRNAWIEKVEYPYPGIFREKRIEASRDSQDEAGAQMTDRFYFNTSANEQNQAISIKGLYKVFVEKDFNSTLDGTVVVNEIRARLNSSRTLCEDFEEVIILPFEEITLKLSIEIDADNAEYLLARILFRIEEAISPSIHFYNLNELLEKGIDIADIFDGPSLQHGFIDDGELGQLLKKEKIFTSDLIREIMKEEGVLVVKDILLSSGSVSNSWKLDLDTEKTPRFNGMDVLGSNAGNKVRLFRNKMKVEVNEDKVKSILSELRNTSVKNILPEKDKNILLPERRDRKVSNYFSIQHHLPGIYGIGDLGLPESASPERKIQAKQLQAYLLFYDQILANNFAQLGNVKSLFSFHNKEINSYFTQPLTHISGVKDLLDNDLVEEEEGNLEEYEDLERKNRFLNHLMSRFGERFTHSDSSAHQKSSREQIVDKMAFLKEYPEISSGRGTAFNFAEGGWDSHNVSGLEKRISKILGIHNYQRRSLSNQNEEGFHMVEHILLRPSKGDLEQQSDFLTSSNPDPYSFQLSFVFPDWTGRFASEEFRSLASRIIREETPAHIIVNIHWFEESKMTKFEEFFRKWIGESEDRSQKSEDGRQKTEE